jgi:hypothetical protein
MDRRCRSANSALVGVSPKIEVSTHVRGVIIAACLLLLA